MEKIIGIGNAITDVLAILNDEELLHKLNLPKGSMQLIDKNTLQNINRIFAKMNTSLATGGSAGNTIKGLSCLGTNTGFIGKIGHDTFGDFFHSSFDNWGIHTNLLTSDEPSGVASTFITPDGERTFGTFLGAAASLTKEDIRPEMLEGYKYLYVEGYLVQNHEMILHAVTLANKMGLKVCMDLASYNVVETDREFFLQLVKGYVDIVFANEEEAKAFTGKETSEALNIISDLCDIAILKVGENGSFIKQGNKTIHVDALPIEIPKDTTGAGDFFSAGFLYGLTQGYSLEKCGEIGSILARNVIEVVGTTLSQTKWDSIKKKINKLS
jgi:sugar/nucleoside kinase (ribokinase family)